MAQRPDNDDDIGNDTDDLFEAIAAELDEEYTYNSIGDYANVVDDDDDDDDPDYQDDGAGENDDDLDEEFHDAETGVELDIVVESDGDDDEDSNDEDDADASGGEAETGTAAIGIPQILRSIVSGRPGAGFLTQRQLLLLLQGQPVGRTLDDEDDDERWLPNRRRRNPPDPNRFPKVPSEKGAELMHSGVFGSTERAATSPLSRKKHLARRVLDRELGLGNRTVQKTNQDLMAQSMIPTTDADMIINYDYPVYSGQFSDDGNFFFSCVKDFRVRMYDTSNPYNWRHYKTVSHPFARWCLTDASLSPDNKWLAYTSIQPTVCLAPTDPNDTGDPYTLDLSASTAGLRSHSWGEAFGIFSVRFSGDGRELVAGTNHNSIIVFDIESRRVLHSIRGHEEDVNAVCFADKQSPHILYSGSDDATLKVWDRRSMGDRREAGAFVGHLEGLTYIDSKGDGRYILSNAKDQSMKLWDLRMAMSTADFERRNPMQHTWHSSYDYRWGNYDEDSWFPHPDDNSLVTFRGHKVQRTLIRCHFSPPGSTNSRYVYSGSHDGQVYVWNLDATLAATINVREAAAKTLARRYRSAGRPNHGCIVREASWHPNAPVLVASAWVSYGDEQFGMCSAHSYNESREDEAEPEMGRMLTDKLEDFHVRRSHYHRDRFAQDWDD